MKQFLIFIGGMAAGALLLYAIGFRTESSVKKQIAQNLIEKLSNLNQEIEIQYVEVKGKKGNVTLHTGMPKDSVKILVGKADEVSLNSYLGSTHESWGYIITPSPGVPRKYQTSDLDIDFVDGKLKSIRQN